MRMTRIGRKQVELVVTEGDESILEIEGASRLIDGIHFHRPNTDLVRDVNCPPQSIDQQKRTKALSLNTLVHGQTTEQHDGNIESGEPPAPDLQAATQSSRDDWRWRSSRELSFRRVVLRHKFEPGLAFRTDWPALTASRSTAEFRSRIGTGHVNDQISRLPSQASCITPVVSCTSGRQRPVLCLVLPSDRRATQRRGLDPGLSVPSGRAPR